MSLKPVRALQRGVAGLFFLLPVLAYKLVIAMLRAPRLDPAVVRLFYWFLAFEFLLVVVYAALKLAESRSRMRR